LDNDGDNDGARIDGDGELIGDGGIDYAGACEFEVLGGSVVLYSCEELGFGIDGYSYPTLLIDCEGECVDQGGEYIVGDEGCGGFNDWDEDASLVHADVEIGINNLWGLLGGDEECIDTDGNNYFVKGYATGTTSGGTVYSEEAEICADRSGSIMLREFSCGEDDILDISYEGCAYGCEDGACQYSGEGVGVGDAEVASNLENMFCTDSDDGKDYFVKGYSSGLFSDEYAEKEDTCGLLELSEWYCSSNKLVLQHYECLNGCEDGACIESEPLEVDWGNVEAITQPVYSQAAEYEDLNWYQKVWNWLFVSESVDVLNY